MEAFAGISILCLVVASAIVGVRLVRLWRRTRELPELFLGLLLLLLAVMGYPLMILSRAESFLGFAVAWPMLILATVCADLGFLMLCAFTWRTFRPDARWCVWLIGAVSAAFLISIGFIAHDTWLARTTVIDMATMPMWRQIMGIVTSGIGYAWTAFESFRYYAVLRRRRALGLAEPLVCNRVFLWGWMSVVTLIAIAVNNVASLNNVDVLATPWILVVSSLAGLAQALFLALIFIPPSAYRDWIARRHAAMAMRTGSAS